MTLLPKVTRQILKLFNVLIWDNIGIYLLVYSSVFVQNADGSNIRKEMHEIGGVRIRIGTHFRPKWNTIQFYAFVGFLLETTKSVVSENN